MSKSIEVAPCVRAAQLRAAIAGAQVGLGLYTSPAGQLQLAEIAERAGRREMAATLRRIARGEVAL